MRYLLRLLAYQQVDQAFPLIQLAAPELSLDRWRSFAHRLALRDLPEAELDHRPPPASGLMTAQDAESYIYGLFCYRIQEGLLSEKVLAVSHFCVCSLLDPAGVAEALLVGIDLLAEALGCTESCVELSEEAGALMSCRDVFLDRFKSFGHRVDGLRFSRRAPGRATAAA